MHNLLVNLLTSPTCFCSHRSGTDYEREALAEMITLQLEGGGALLLEHAAAASSSAEPDPIMELTPLTAPAPDAAPPSGADIHQVML